MEKFLLVLLSVILVIGCFASCSEETPEIKPMAAPADEITVTKTFSAKDEMGLQMEIVISGYASEGLNQKLYVKKGEAFNVEVRVKNITERDILHLSSTSCHGSEHDHLHDLQFYIQDGEGHSLAPAWSAWYTCPEMMAVWSIPAGKTCTWSFTITPDVEMTEDGFRDFFGTIAFSYAHWNNGVDTKNDLQIATSVFIKVFEFTTNKNK